MSVPYRDLLWRRSSQCSDRQCTEVASHGDDVYVRDGKRPDGAVLCFTRAEWEAFREGVKLGEFDSI